MSLLAYKNESLSHEVTHSHWQWDKLIVLKTEKNIRLRQQNDCLTVEATKFFFCANAFFYFNKTFVNLWIIKNLIETTKLDFYWIHQVRKLFVVKTTKRFIAIQVTQIF